MNTPHEPLNLASVIDRSQAIAGEIVLDKLIDTLMLAALEHTTAERGLLILAHLDELQIEAEATTSGERVTVHLRHASVTPADMPESILHHVVQTRDSVLVQDTSAASPFSADEYIGQMRARSMLCLPLIKQARLVGVLYLENHSTPDVFTPARIATVNKLASQAAISVGSARGYAELQEENRNLKHAEQELRRQKAHLDQFDQLFDLAPQSIVLSELNPSRIIRVNNEFMRMFGYTPEEAVGHSLRELIVPEELQSDFAQNSQSIALGQKVDAEVVRKRKDGTRFHAHLTAAPVELTHGRTGTYVIYSDITERKQAEALLAGERQLLEMIATGNSLGPTLDALCRVVEELSSGSLASILVLDADGKRLRHGAAPSLPKSYTQAIDGSYIGPCAGSCGTAAHRREPVIASDIETDPLWTDYRDLAAAQGLRACWSTPILSSEGRVLGTFAIYCRVPCGPSPHQQNIIQQFTHLASIAIERAQAEEALRRSEERYALAVEATGDGHWDWNIPTDEFYPSQVLLNICGLPVDATFATRSEFIDQFPFHPDDRPDWEKAITAHFAGNTARFEMEIRIVPRGETRWIHLTGLCLRDASGGPVRWTGSVTDVTERKCAEEELRARQQMLDLAQKAARAVAFEWHIGVEERQNRWSPDLEAIHGLAPGSYDGTFHTWKKLIHPDDWPSVKAAIRHAQDSGEVAAEYRVVNADGTVRWLQAKGRMLSDVHGKPTRMLGFMLDVTERCQAEEELRRLERQLRQAQRLEAMGTLAGGIAHDFNNILGAILGFGEMALRDASKGSRLRRDLDSILTAGERGRALVDRILAFSRSGVGERVAVHVEKVVREALDLLSARLPDGVHVQATLNAGRAAMRGDPTQVHQLLMNLATNAIQAMPSGGRLQVSLHAIRVAEPRVATIGKIAAREYVVLQVTDGGTGIPPEVLDRIFDPFFTTKEVGVGTGLGLSLVHGIVTELGGAIDVASTQGAGSVFTVYLPRAGDAADTGVTEEVDVPRGDRQRVLVVDDEEPLVRLATATLEELGYVASGFTSSAAALEAFRANPEQFDAVITDERMPGMSGSALIHEVRGIRRAIPILLVSGYVGGLVANRAYNAGADEVLKKPLSARELATSLARVLHAQ
jgi:PAS domain S-box-containing protein